jgi:hypothetical protein
MSKIINTDEIVSLTPFAVKDLHVFIRGQNKLSIAQTIPVTAGDRFVLLAHNDFTSTNGKLIKCSVDDTKHTRGWLDCLIGYPVYHGTPNHECQFVVVEKTVGQNYFTVVRSGVFIAGKEMRVLEQKSAVAAASEEPKHDAKKSSRPLRKSLNASGDQPVASAAVAAPAAPARFNLRIKPGSGKAAPGIVADAPIARDQSLNASGEAPVSTIVNDALDKLTETAVAELKEYKRTSKIAIDQDLEKHRIAEKKRITAELAAAQQSEQARLAKLTVERKQAEAELVVLKDQHRKIATDLKRNRDEASAIEIKNYPEEEVLRRVRARLIPAGEL